MVEIVHVTLGNELGGMPELVRAEVKELHRRSISARWVSLNLPPEDANASAALSDWLHDVTPRVPQVPREAHAALDRFGSTNAEGILSTTLDGDVVVLHDPVPLGLASYLPGRRVVWRSHIGARSVDGNVASAAEALNPFLDNAEIALFHRQEYAWAGIPTAVATCSPGLDLADIKIRDLEVDDERDSDLLSSGALGAKAILTNNGTGFLPDLSTPFTLHVSRWDPMKGQEQGLRASLPALEKSEEHYVLLGPDIGNTLMGATNRNVLRQLLACRKALAGSLRRRVHIWTFSGVSPSSSGQREAINRVRTRAGVVVSPSVREGFGLGVAEALYGRSKVLATPVGGHLDQVESGVNGWLSSIAGGRWAEDLAEIQVVRPTDGMVRDAARRGVAEHFTVACSVDQQLSLLGLVSGTP